MPATAWANDGPELAYSKQALKKQFNRDEIKQLRREEKRMRKDMIHQQTPLLLNA
ncbi:hypothetical protein T492DRAFT_910568 [Pavlovales sp. CCMP2436]|nr:hypothetical protein T492DRAFT_910568 [Pavlovales sp. CCMP2436]